MKIRNLVKHFQKKKVPDNSTPLPSFFSALRYLPDHITSGDSLASQIHAANSTPRSGIPTSAVISYSSFIRFLRMLDALRELDLAEPLLFHAAYACLKAEGISMNMLLGDGIAFINNFRHQQENFQHEWKEAWVQYVAVKLKLIDDLMKENQELKECLRQNESRIRKLSIDKKNLEDTMEQQYNVYFERSNHCIGLLEKYLERLQYYIPDQARTAS